MNYMSYVLNPNIFHQIESSCHEENTTVFFSSVCTKWSATGLP